MSKKSLTLFLLIFLFFLFTPPNLIQCRKYREIKNRISVCYATDDGYFTQTLISLSSLLYSKNNSTFYDIYILTSYLSSLSIGILKNIERHFWDCSITIIDMKDSFKDAKIVKSTLSATTYFRLDLPSLLPPAVQRIIYLDGDTVIFKDLSEMHELEFNGNYILGFPDERAKAAEIFGKYNSSYICNGVTLVNIKLMRKDGIREKFKEFMKNNINNLPQEDQTVVNIVCAGKIGFLPPQYGIWNFWNENDLIRHNNKQFEWNKYNESELIEAWKDPTIVHFVRGKPWKLVSVHQQKWEEISKKLGIS